MWRANRTARYRLTSGNARISSNCASHRAGASPKFPAVIATMNARVSTSPRRLVLKDPMADPLRDLRHQRVP